MLQDPNIKQLTRKFSVIERARRVDLLFCVAVIIPTLLSIAYFGIFASDVYISESYFVVRSADKKPTLGLGSLLTGQAGLSSGAAEETSAVQEYMGSRDALRALEQNRLASIAYTRPEVDVFSRFGSLFGNDSFERLFKYYKKRVDASYDSSKSVTVLKVRAYQAEDAQRINERLLQLGEGLVNRLNERSRRDLVRSAQAEVDEAKVRLATAGTSLSRFRNSRRLVDPEKQAPLQLQLVSKLQDQLIATRTQLDQISAFTPQNPMVEVLQKRLQSLQQEINSETGKVAGANGSLAAEISSYQRLALDSQIAEKQLAAAMVSLQDARNEARRQQVYLARVSQPNLPDEALEPERMRGVLATLLFSLILWGVLKMLLAGVREHEQ